MLSNHHFISYSSIDGLDFSLKLCSALETEQPFIKMWLDKRDLRPGEDWDEQIVEAIKTCDSLLFIMTYDSVQPTSVCKLEWTMALKYKKPVVPLLLHHDAEIPFRLTNRHYIDFSSDFGVGLTALCNHLNWLNSPAGISRTMKDRLKDAERDLRRTHNDTQRTRLLATILQLKEDIAQQDKIVSNPQQALLRIQKSIELGLERERSSGKRIVGKVKSRVINQAPGVVPSYFQDRFIETKLVGDFLKNTVQNLTTIVGRGGVGKTAMVCRLLASLENGELPDDGGPLKVDGIVYLSSNGWRRVNMVNLYSDLCALLPDEIAQKLDALYKEAQASSETKMRALLTELSARLVVVLLDNFDDVVDLETRQIIDKELDEALRALLNLPKHNVKVLITTRIAPYDLLLTCPERQGYIQLDDGLPSPYAENILREMDTDGKLGLKDAEVAVLASVRDQTRGYPRALEALVAALRADSYTSLDDLLTATNGQLPENVVYTLVGEAFSRLDPSAQKIIQALAVYHRPVTPIAVDYILQPYLSGQNSVSTLNRLSSMHFIRRESRYYYLHPIDRAYALERIPKGKSNGQETDKPPFTRLALLHRGAEYFKQVRKEKIEWKKIEDLIEVLAEFELRCEGEEYGTAAEILMEIDNEYLFVWGYYRLVAELHERLQGRINDNRLKVTSLRRLGGMYANMGLSEQAITCYKQSRTIAQEIGDRQGEGRALSNMGLAYDDLGQTTHAIECHKQALLIAREIGDRWCEGATLASLGASYDDLGQAEQVIEYCEQGVAIAREINDLMAEGVALSNLARALINMGRYGEAIQRAYEGVQTLNPRAGSYNNGYLALAYLYSMDLVSARKAAEVARKYDESLNNHFVLALLGVIALLQGDKIAANDAFLLGIKRAEELLTLSPQNREALDAKGLALSGLVLCERNANHIPAAIESYRQARAINKSIGYVKRSLQLFGALTQADSSGLLMSVLVSVVNT